MIIVPPILNIISMSADHIDANPSARVRVPETKTDISTRLPVIPRIEYLSTYTYSKTKISCQSTVMNEKKLSIEYIE